MAIPLKMPVIKKVKIGALSSAPAAQYLTKRRDGMAENFEENAKPTLDAMWLKSRNCADEDRDSANPFALPKDADMFTKRENDSIIEKQEKKFFNRLPTEMKSTFLSRLRCRSAPQRTVEESTLETDDSMKDKNTWATAVTKGRCQGRESVRDYLAKQKEMFMIQYSLSVKHDTIKQLEKDIVVQKKRNLIAEKHLENDAIAFERFIKENDQKSVEAVKLAERETLLKVERTTEIKKVMAKMMSIRSDISKYQEILKEYQIYKRFLTAVAPAEWRKELSLKKEKRAAEQWGKLNKDKQSLKHDKKVCTNGKQNSKVTKTTQARPQNKSGKECAGRQESITEMIEPSDSDEEPELYFTDPRQMLHILTDLEEQNLSFIQNFQETEEARDKISKTVQLMQKKMAYETQDLQQQIDILNNTIQREEEKTAELELKSKIFSYGEYRIDSQDHMLNALHKKMKEVFKLCVGEVETNISTLHMLTNIESRMEEVLERLDTLPSDNVEAIRTAKEKEKRLKMREEKMEKKKRHQEERLRIAIERATSDSKKQTGRKLMPRSEPSAVKKNQVCVMSSKEQEDYLYFFT